MALGVAVETPYPDGGYYRLEKDGAIRIGFTVLPALKNGSIVLELSADQYGAIHWDCIAHGDLATEIQRLIHLMAQDGFGRWNVHHQPW